MAKHVLNKRSVLVQRQMVWDLAMARIAGFGETLNVALVQAARELVTAQEPLVERTFRPADWVPVGGPSGTPVAGITRVITLAGWRTGADSIEIMLEEESV